MDRVAYATWAKKYVDSHMSLVKLLLHKLKKCLQIILQNRNYSPYAKIIPYHYSN